uniref:Aminotransferase-like plant mobile domain-containing protein n=1 Tax=Oryza punctata TaxID=4537 RepID=A0A0E0KKP1_ORYPU
MASDTDADADADADELRLVLYLPMDMAKGHEVRRPAHLLPPLAGVPPPPPPFRPPPLRAAASNAEARVSFRGWLGGPRHWDLWVAKLRPLHDRLWRHLGILDAIVASTYRFKRDAALVLHLASFWSPTTSSFAFPWGEATVSLLDVALLGGLPANGGPVPAALPSHWRADEAALNAVRLGFNRSACKKAHHSAWISHFLTGPAADPVVEHAAFLSLWLTRFVLPGHPESTMRQSLFPLAVRMARGDRVALAPAVLASMYRDLRELKTFLSSSSAAATGELLSPLSVYAPFYLLQLWAWERFPAIRPAKANPIKAGEPRAARWNDVSNKINPAVLRKALSSGSSFVWQPYTISVQPCGWVRGCHVSGNDELTSLAHCLRACELVGMDCIEQYLPHRVAMQFGLDQDVPGDVQRANDDCRVAWETYHLEGKNVAFFIPQSEPGVTARYAEWWRQPLPPSHLDVGAVSTTVESKVSKRKVKKTLVAIEAEEEKERKMKKARVLPSNNDKKRKLQELYDAKLSDCLAAARDEGAGSCDRGSLPLSDMESEKTLLSYVETINDEIVLLVPRKQTAAPAVNLIKDNMNLATGDRGSLEATPPVGMEEKDEMPKAQQTCTVEHPTDQSYCQETKAAPSTEITKGESSGIVLANDNELDRGRTPDVSNWCEEAVPSEPMEKEESRYHLSDVVCNDEGIKDVVTVDKPLDVSNEPEGGVTAMLEEKMLNVSVDKSLDATDRPEEGTTIMLELQKEANLSVDESCRVLNSPEEVPATVPGDKEEKVDIFELDEGNGTSEDVGTAALGSICSIEVVPGSKQEVDTGVINISHDAVTSPDEVLPVQHVNDGETTCHDFVTEEQRKACCIEEIGGENSQMVEKASKQKPHEAHQVNMVECGENINPMENDNEDEHEKIPQPLENVISDSNMTSVFSGVPEAENADADKGLYLAKKGTEDMPKEVVGAEGSQQDQFSPPTHEVVDEQNEVADVEHIVLAEPNIHAQCDGEKPEEGNVLREKDTEENAKNALGVEQIERQDKALTESCIHEVEQVDEQSERLTGTGVEEKHEEITQAQENEFDNDVKEASKVSVNGAMLCSTASIQSEGEQKEASDEGMAEKQCNQDIEFIDERDSLSDAAAVIVEGADDHITLNTNEEVPRKQIHDSGSICENKDVHMLQEDCKLDSGLKSDIDIIEIETQATEGIQNQEAMELDKQQEMEEEQNPGTTIENSKMKILEKDANTLSCGEIQTDPPCTDVNEVEFTTGMQNDKNLDIKEELIMDRRLDCEIKYGNDRPLEEANTFGGCDSGVDNIGGVSLDVNEENSIKGMQNQEIRSTEEASEFQAGEANLNNGAENVNEKRTLEDASTVDSGDSTNAVVNGAESKEGTQILCALNTEKEKQDQGTENENTNQNLVNTDSFECGLEPDGTLEATHETLPTVQVVKTSGDTFSSKNQQNDVPLEDQNKSDAEVSESNQTATKESERAIPPEHEDQEEEKEENMENKIEISIGYYSRHAVPEPVSVTREIKVPLYDSTRASGRDRGPELVVAGPPEETSRWRQEQYALQILEDVQNARIAEKTRMEMEIRILKAQVSSMQRQAMNLDRVGDLLGRRRLNTPLQIKD